ncbi:MAG: enoyl-CoA hydratase-related protein [Sulfuricaulis sp.]|nr:enoyl-CoA hydratase-related protein [Sulfuricaulis sp.]
MKIWYWCPQYTAQEARELGLVNKAVPVGQALAEAKIWAAEVAAMSPTPLKALKASFNCDTAQIFDQTKMAYLQLEIWGTANEVMEGKKAFAEKRKPDFSKFR